MHAIQAAARLVPSARGPWLLDVGLDWVRQDPEPGAAMLQGMFFNRVAPPREIRRTLDMPALVIGHQRDPVHPFSDSGALVEEMPNARLVQASSILEGRVRPERLTNEISTFLDECWRPRGTRDGAPRDRRVA
jgi:pimeloyl-ACP methyl ester carboxylesterase